MAYSLQWKSLDVLHVIFIKLIAIIKKFSYKTNETKAKRSYFVPFNICLLQDSLWPAFLIFQGLLGTSKTNTVTLGEVILGVAGS